MKSMTGFGYREFQDERISLSLEIKSYNNRYLDVIVNVPSFLGPLEPRLREYLSGGVQRGRVELTLKVKELEEDVRIHLDRSTAKAYAEALQDLIEVSGIDDRLHLSHLMKMEGVLKLEKNRDLESYWKLLQPLLQGTFEEFENARVREGRATADDIFSQIDVISRNLTVVEGHAPDLERHLKESLKSRFEEMLGQGVDENRVFSETAVLLVKYSINEEVVRLKSHLSNFHDVASQGGSIGRKLDFLCQEMNREVNTIGSKSILIEINQAVIEMKDALEKVREQLRNVE